MYFSIIIETSCNARAVLECAVADVRDWLCNVKTGRVEIEVALSARIAERPLTGTKVCDFSRKREEREREREGYLSDGDGAKSVKSATWRKNRRYFANYCSPIDQPYVFATCDTLER